jgi:Ca2+-binding RTX toxin-like protein
MGRIRLELGVVVLALNAACGPLSSDEAARTDVDRQRLSPLQSPCVFSAAAGTVTITLASSEFAYVERRASDSALLINGDVCNSAGGLAPFAKSTTAPRATITGDASGGETLVLDFGAGAYFRGTTTAPGLIIDLAGGGTDAVQVRMSALKDTVRVGSNGWDITGDGIRDFTLANVSAVVMTLGDGDDSFSALGGGTLGTPSAVPVTVYGGNGNDMLTGGDGDDTLEGDSGNDTLSGGSSLTDGDVFHGGIGTDTVTYATRSTSVTITVGAGADDGAATETDDVTADVEIVTGGSAADTFTGTTGAQTFYGGAGDDTFRMGLLASTGAGGDTVYGEAGIDTVDYAARLEAVTVTMDLNIANDGATGESDNVRADVERLICPASAGCTVTGNALDNRFTGGSGVDVFDGAGGDDTFVLGAGSGLGGGADRFIGGPGVDLIDFSAFGASVDLRMDDVGSTTQGKRIGLDVENLVCPSASACTVEGNAANNHLWGSTQNDTLHGNGGDDLIETGGGSDTIDCGDGSDILLGTGASPVGTTCEL